MTRQLRAFLFFLAGLLLGGFASWAAAETQPMQRGYCAKPIYGTTAPVVCGTDAAALCASLKGASWLPTAFQTRTIYWDGAQSCNFKGVPGTSFPYDGSVASVYTSQACDTANGWVPQNGQCYRPDPCPMYGTSSGDSAGAAPPSGCTCPAGTKWQPGGGCRKTCDTGAGERPWGDPSLSFPAGASEACFGGCVVQPQSDEFYAYPDGSRLYSHSTSTGWACDTSQTAPTKPPTPDAPKLPPGKPSTPSPACGEGEGVLTSSSGRLGCVPQGTPENKLPTAPTPQVQKTNTFTRDSTGQEITKETVLVRDPTTGAYQETSTTTDGNGNSTTSGRGGNGPSSGGFCAENPDHITCIKGTVGDKGKFDVNAGEVDQARSRLRAEFDAIKAQASGLFSASSSAAGSLPCPPPVMVLGRSFNVCLTDKADALSVIAAVVMLAAAIVAAMIVFH